MPTDIRMLFGRLPPFTHYAGNRSEWGHWSCTDKQKVGRRRALAFAKVCHLCIFNLTENYKTSIIVNL